MQSSLFTKKTLTKVQEDSLTVQQVIDNFYDSLSMKFSNISVDFAKVSSYQDEEAVKRYQRKALQAGQTKSEALISLNTLIKYFFKYYDLLGLTSPITSLDTLLNLKFSWLSSKIVDIHVKAMKDYEDSEEVEILKEKIYNTTDDIALKIQEQRHKELLEIYSKENISGKKRKS